MISLTFLGILVVYLAPLALFFFAMFKSRYFQRESELVHILVGMGEQAERLRDIIATLCVPILALFIIPLDRKAPFDLESLSLAGTFLASALLSLVGYGICRASVSRLRVYGEEYAPFLDNLLANYSRETLIYFAVMFGVSAGPAVSR
jgi:hypothetical protein